jgi:HEAT repeat protein
VPALIQVLADPDAEVRGEAAAALREVGGPARPQLIEALRDPRRAVRWGAAHVLAATPPGEATAVVPALVEALKEPRSRSAALSVLTRFGRDSRGVASGLARP